MVLEETYVYQRQLDKTGQTVANCSGEKLVRWRSEDVNLTKNGTVLGMSSAADQFDIF